VGKSPTRRSKVVLTNRSTSIAAHPNPKACIAKIECGTFELVRGTGVYAGAHGSATYGRNSKIVGSQLERCRAGRSSNPAAMRSSVRSSCAGGRAGL